MVAPKMRDLNWMLWGAALISVAVAFYLTTVGEKVVSTVLFVVGYAVLPVLAIMVGKASENKRGV